MPPTTAITKSLRTLRRRQAKLDQIDTSLDRATDAMEEAAHETLEAIYRTIGDDAFTHLIDAAVNAFEEQRPYSVIFGDETMDEYRMRGGTEGFPVHATLHPPLTSDEAAPYDAAGE